MSKDTIYRQAAIDAVREAQHRFTVADEAGGLGTVKWSEDVIYFAAAERVLSDLPSAQPEMNDTISRQDAINTSLRFFVEFLGGAFHENAQKELIARFQNLPPAQPEREKGAWIATYSDCGADVCVTWKCCHCGYVRKKGWEHTDAGEKPDALFCEICGADMRGGEQ